MSTTAGPGFAATLADYLTAEPSTRYGAAPDAATRAADRLPLSEWSEARRDILSPQTVAMNWRANVSDTAHDLREALTAQLNGGTAGSKKAVRKAARALLRALGED